MIHEEQSEAVRHPPNVEVGDRVRLDAGRNEALEHLQIVSMVMVPIGMVLAIGSNGADRDGVGHRQ